MLVKLDNPKILSDVVSIISDLVSEVKIKFDSKGMSIIAIDPANVALVSFKLPAEAFSQFESGNETLGINLSSLKAVLRRAGIGSNLLMHTEDNILNVYIQDKIKRHFAIALIDIEQEDKDVPSLEFTTKIDMSSRDFVDAIEDCAVVSDACSLYTDENKFGIEAKGLHSAKAEFSSDEVKLQNVGKSRSKYSLEYLQKFIKASKLSDKTSVNFSSDYPLRLDFNSGKLALSFILAPRVESED